jgi:hypothetical protein
VNGTHIGGTPTVPDHGNHKWEQFLFPLPLTAGQHQFQFDHLRAGEGGQSVIFKAGYCANP